MNANRTSNPFEIAARLSSLRLLRTPHCRVLALAIAGLAAGNCGGPDDPGNNPVVVPPYDGGSGGFNPDDKGRGGSGGGVYGSGPSSSGSGNQPPAPPEPADASVPEDSSGGNSPVCAEQFKRCDHSFRYPVGSESSVELRGDFKARGWDSGVQLVKNGTEWTATVPVPSNFEFKYKFLIDGKTWKTDPNNPDLPVSDGQGGQNSVFKAAVCTTWTCATEAAPAACAEASRQCDYKFVYPVGTETSVEVRGDWSAPTSWASGTALVKNGTLWSAYVPLAWGKTVLYKFYVNGKDWAADPGNIDVAPDGNSRIKSVTCGWWTCVP